MYSPFVTLGAKDKAVFFITEEDVKGILEALEIEISTGRLIDLLHFVGDRFDNRAPEDIADAIIDFFDYGEER